MLGSEAGWALAAKLRGTARQHRQERLTSKDEPDAVSKLVPVVAERTNLLTWMADPAGKYGVNGSGNSRRQVAGLLIRTGADQEIIPLRRGEGWRSAECEILVPVDSSSAEAETKTDAAAASSEGVSAFIARVLDQLTLSAWLPAALFTAAAAVLLQFRRQRSVNVLHAVGVLAADPVRVLVLIIPLLVLATVVTQAFSFEAIRTLEGYWRRRGLADIARTLMIRRHVHRKEAITRRKRKVYEDSFYVTRPRIIKAGIPPSVVNALEAEALGEALPTMTDEEQEKFQMIEWEDWCDAWRRAKIDYLTNDELAYPIISRVLPTRLGNLVRATEDQLKNAGDDLEGFVLRRYAMATRRVQMQHDQFRNRLEMYCILVFVSALLLALTPAMLLGRGIDAVAIVIISGGFAMLSVASYLAAVASAGGYCAALKQMDETPETADEAQQVTVPGP